MMKLEDLGYHDQLEKYRIQHGLDAFGVGRVVAEHKDRYVVRSQNAVYDAELLGNLRYTAESKHDLPAVGDWVAISEYDDQKALIHAVLPRKSIIERQAAGKSSEIQIIATNIDYGLIVQSVNRDYNINRLERYLTICNASKVEPIIILSKVDLVDEEVLSNILKDLEARVHQYPIIPLSNVSDIGLDKLKARIENGKTYCLLGSSGVGKSTLLNKLSGKELMDTADISTSIDRGKHVTTHRELIVLGNGGILIDNPGMREIGMTQSSQGLEITFDEIIELSQNCKYKNCTHTNESKCAVLEALESGVLDQESYANFLKMEKERAFFESSTEEKKKKDKQLGKIIKDFQKQRRKDKF